MEGRSSTKINGSIPTDFTKSRTSLQSLFSVFPLEAFPNVYLKREESALKKHSRDP